MYKLTAFYALQVKMLRTSVPVKVLVASTGAVPHHHFTHNTVGNKLVKGAVNGGSADFVALLL